MKVWIFRKIGERRVRGFVTGVRKADACDYLDQLGYDPHGIELRRAFARDFTDGAEAEKSCTNQWVRAVPREHLYSLGRNEFVPIAPEQP